MCDLFVSIRELALQYCDIMPRKIIADSSIFSESDYSNISNGSKVFVPTGSLHKFVRFVSNVNVRFVLLTGAGVFGVPNEISVQYNIPWRRFVSTHVIRWYTQNIDVVDHPMIRPLPLGVDFHTLSSAMKKRHTWGASMTVCDQNRVLENTRNIPFHAKKNIIYVPMMAKTKRNGNDRVQAYVALKGGSKKGILKFQTRVMSRANLWSTMNEYKFIVSPLGMGMDCHRTWETFALGSIPIIKNSTLVPTLFKNMKNLIVVCSWREVNRKNLVHWLQKYNYSDSNDIRKFARLNHWIPTQVC